MKLRIWICLFAVVSVCMVLFAMGYLSVRRDYEGLNRKYEEALAQMESDSEEEEAGQASDQKDGMDSQDLTNEQGGLKLSEAEEEFYYVTLVDSEIIAYTGDRSEIRMRTQIDEQELAEVMIRELKQGIYLKDLPALYDYLENCSS